MPDSPEAKSELELLREQNIKVRDAFFMSLIKDDPDFADVMKLLANTDKPSNKKLRVRRSASQDPTFRCHSSVPLERRKSARLQNKQPEIIDSEVDSPTYKRKRSDSDYDDLEEVIYKPKKTKTNIKRSVHHIISPEEIEDKMIKNIVKRTSEKIYSGAGTCCHQCRQKTMDQKTCCRNPNCVGVRGQFCGICLYNRYGEICSEALKDPNWHCPVCRGICNCSFCRAKAGKRPTGILTPMAHQAGHKSVKDFLDSLKGQGDYANQDNSPRKEPAPDNLLGFVSNGNAAYENNVQQELEAPMDLDKMNDLCQQEEDKLVKEEDDGMENLLGFYHDSNFVLLENNIRYELMPLCVVNNLEDIDEDKGNLYFTENDIKTEMNSDLLQETQSTAASG